MELNNGYVDLPAGKIANIQTCLGMFARPARRPDPPSIGCSLDRMGDPDISRYRALFRDIGGPYLWTSRLLLSDEELRQTIGDPRVEVYVVRCNDRDAGIVELDFRAPNECELRFFGLSDSLVGKGAGRWAMNRAIDRAWSRNIKRFWVHTCSLDHPAALPFYIRSGFRPFKRQIEIMDDPRLNGTLPRDIAPHIPLI